MSFTHLHLHTSYSLLDGAGRIDDIVMQVRNVGQKAVAITDHGNMYGVISFFEHCVINGIKPIIGCEIYVTDKSRLEKSKDDQKYYHLILLCENEIGYNNLKKIVSIGFTDGYYYKPRVDYEILNKYHEGLICLTACLAGEVPTALLKQDYNLAKLKLDNYINIFGKNNVYLEIQNHGLEKEFMVQPQIIKLSKDTGIKLVATNDVHYTLKEDAFAHDCLLCLQTVDKLSNPNRMRYEGNNYYIKSESEMREDFKFCLEAIDNTQEIVDRCNVVIEFTKDSYKSIVSLIDKNLNEGLIDIDYRSMIRQSEYKVPVFDIPSGFDNISYLKYLVDKGIKTKIKTMTEEIKKRINYELDIIINMGFVDYFLIVWDYINFAKTHDIPVGPGRGSSVGSIVAYLLGITEIIPLPYNLLFERFLNPERVSMPDIDTDFCVIGREEVIDYVKQKYGIDHVAQIATFGTLGAKQVIKDVGRVMEISLKKTTEMSNLIPKMPNITLDKMLNSNINEEFTSEQRLNVLNFRDLYKNDDEANKIINVSLRLEGIPRQTSVHASGVLIAPDDVKNFVPLTRTKDESITTEWTMTELEHLGLLKMDFLGLRNLTAIKDCIRLIKLNKNIDLDISIDKLDINDKNVFDMIGQGDTLGVFQLDSTGMTNFMKRLKPTTIEDLIAGISLYRPGPMDFIPQYVDGKKNADNIKYDCKELEDILKPTYGCIVYQEQVMQIVQKLAGYSLGKADEVRRLMSKKKFEALLKEEQKFLYGDKEQNIDGCVKRGIPEKVGKKIFDEMKEFARYAFNKSHATAYAFIAYQTAYLKYYYRLEFYTSLCNSLLNKRDDLVKYVKSIKEEGTKFLLPDINKSELGFSTEGESIRIGFSCLKGVGAKISEDIIYDRTTNGPYVGFSNTVSRISEIGANKKAIECLILSGAFDEFPGNRNQKFCTYYKALKKNIDIKEKNVTLFDYFDINEEKDNDLKDEKILEEAKDVKEFKVEDKLSFERDLIGIYISGHPLSKYQKFIQTKSTITSSDLEVDSEGEVLSDVKDGQTVKIVGIIESVSFRVKKTRWATLSLEDMDGSFNAVAFNKVLETSENLLKEGNVVLIQGTVQFRQDQKGEILINNVSLVEPVVWVRFNTTNEYDNQIKKLYEISSLHQGRYDMILFLNDTKEQIRWTEKISMSDDFLDVLYDNYNKDNVRITYK